MKKWVIGSVALFWLFIFGMVLLAKVSLYPGQNYGVANPAGQTGALNQTSPAASSNSTSSGSSVTLTAASVASHADSSSCWVIISGNVYDITNFLPQHRASIACGSDVTSELERQHGLSYLSYLDPYKLGPLSK